MNKVQEVHERMKLNVEHVSFWTVLSGFNLMGENRYSKKQKFNQRFSIVQINTHSAFIDYNK
jgi:hypothetical protein